MLENNFWHNPKASQIRLLICDVDGVLTDGSLVYGENGETLKVFDCKDGLGLRLLTECGISTAIISARSSKALANRISDLQIDYAMVGHDDKIKALEIIKEKSSIPYSSIAYVGDDILDIPVMRKVGLPIAVSDAHPLVRGEAKLITRSPGGKGAVREIADMLIGASHDLQKIVNDFLASKLGDARLTVA